ncbi:hypothetical protein [Dyadobacter sp. BHUBP1]|uniref:hypothetical protein n=1 Tax=Dyadobacter sp. BHUBP1 TaxID=3424178 RepID=UPI003D33C999
MKPETREKLLAILLEAQAKVPFTAYSIKPEQLKEIEVTSQPDKNIRDFVTRGADIQPAQKGIETVNIFPPETRTRTVPYQGFRTGKHQPSRKRQGNTVASTANKFTVEAYSEWSIVVRGDTKPIKDQLKALGGRFNFRLQGGAGWIFPKRQETQLRQLLS